MATIIELSQIGGNYKDGLFAHGYIMSRSKPTVPASWCEATFAGRIIAHHPKLQLTVGHASGAEIVCLGIIFDGRYPSLDQQELVDQLAVALSKSEEEMLDIIRHSNGRYAIIFKGSDGRPYMLHDATGMRTVLFHVGEDVTVSSHLKLLELNIAWSGKRDLRAQNFGFPGRSTPNRDVLTLTPNCKLCIQSGQVARYWPLRAVSKQDVPSATDKVAEVLSSSFDWIDRRFNHFATLTAGLDSRVTLSIIKGRSRYATYYRRDDADMDKLDLETAALIAKECNLDHTILGPESRENVPDDFMEIVSINTFRRHIPKMSWAYANKMAKDGSQTVHIRSNLSEIGRMFYQSRHVVPKNGRDLNRLWSNKKDLQTDENATLFQEFADATAFFETPVEHTSLFYWEHRMGLWHSQIPVESDIACETLSLYNSRHLLETLWSVSESEQKNSSVLKQIIMNRWPKLIEFPINGRAFTTQ